MAEGTSDNLVRDVHDAVARSDSAAEASVRPPGTTPRELAAMRRDVLRKLALAPGMQVAEIGCGVGLLGVPVAERAGRYLGLDFAPQAVRVANERLRAAGLDDHAEVLCLDALSLGADELAELGSFERVLAYAVLHYARSEEEAVRFLALASGLLAPGGSALIGNLPLDDLQGDWVAQEPAPKGVLARLVAVTRWVMSPSGAPVPLTRRWKARRVVETAVRSRSTGESFRAARLPANYTLSLSSTAIERWLAELGEDLSWEWRLPAPGVPLASGRADLIVRRG